MLHWNVRKTDRGFTLTEMLITVIVAGILAAISIPSLVGMFAQNKIKQSLAQVEGALKESQRQSMRRGIACKIKIDTVTVDGKPRRRVTVSDSEPISGVTRSYAGCLLSDRTLPQNIAISATTSFGSPPKIAFSHKGNTTSSGTIVFSSSDSSSGLKCLTISNGLGIIRTGDYTGDTSSIDENDCDTLED